jgi:hypothetical protein
MEAAMHQVSAATEFRSATVGIAAVTPPEVTAWREILAAPDADARFKRLLESRSAAGRLYGLAGVYLTDPDAFARALPRLAARDESVAVVEGCIVGSRPFGTLAREIALGSWSHQLRGAARPAPSSTASR